MKKNPEVEEWLATYDNPMKATVMRVREIILAADARVTEAIKWQAPTFMYRGNIASFYPKAKKHASLMFHQGAAIPGGHAILIGEGGTSRTAQFADLAEVEEKRAALEAVVRAWCTMKDGA